jgi:hypothetical protein
MEANLTKINPRVHAQMDELILVLCKSIMPCGCHCNAHIVL